MLCCILYVDGCLDIQFLYVVWNPDLVYLGCSISFIDEVDPDRLSLFERQDIWGDLGAISTSRFHYLIPKGNLEQGLGVEN